MKMLLSIIKNNKNVLSKINLLIIFIILICDISVVNSAVFKSPNKDDASYWRTYAENYLKKVLTRTQTSKNVAKNVIIFLGDGMGMATITAARIYKGQQRELSGEEESLEFDEFPHIGLAKTYNTNKQVPDSAGTATALFTGVKTIYRGIGVDATVTETNVNQTQLSSIIDWAQSVGKRTGLVTTTRVTHATPASLYAHSFHRDWECNALVPEHLNKTTKDIARQLVENLPGTRMNVVLGGGRDCFGASIPSQLVQESKFGGKFEKTCIRTDGLNLTQAWLNSFPNKSIEYVTNTAQLLNVDIDEIDHLLGLFSDNHMSYNKIRDRSQQGEPSLAEMVEIAIKILNNKNSSGFVLMVEGGRIDQAHHQNHAHLALEETLEFDKAVKIAKELTYSDETLIIVTADHSHSLTLNGYPTRGNDILGFANKDDTFPYETLTYANGPGFNYHRDNVSSDARYGTWLKVEELGAKRNEITYQHLATFPLGDETHGGEDVPVYSNGPGSELLAGVFEQNYVAYAVSYAACIGPVESLNDNCRTVIKSSSAKFTYSSVFIIVLSILLVNFY
uniref:Alkaline phosphatase n=1 Tax=Corethrella appendiculata TaxID=1370023 RepID=U5EGW1_9DIPT